MRPTLRPLCAAVLLATFSVAARAQESWTLSTANLQTESVGLRSIDDKGVNVVGGISAQPRTIPHEQFLQLDRSLPPVERPAKFMLHMAGGDRVGGEPVNVENDRLTWRTASVGELTIPLRQVVALVKSGQGADVHGPGGAEDVVLLANGDTVRGIVSALSGADVSVKTADGGDVVKVTLDSIAAVYFATAGGPVPATSRADKVPTYRVRLSDGSSVVGTSLSLAGDKLSIAIGGAGDARPIDLGKIVGIEQVNGPVSWLTSRTPSQEVQIPFVAASAVATEQPMWRTRIDTDVAGQPLVVAGRAFKRGIGVHSYSRLVYPLDGTYKAFRTRYGINDSLVRADVTVRILVGEKTVHETKNVKAGVLSPVVVVDLPADAKELVLEVDYGQGIDVEDRLNWLEPALLREKPKAESPATAPSTKPAQ